MSSADHGVRAPDPRRDAPLSRDHRAGEKPTDRRFGRRIPRLPNRPQSRPGGARVKRTREFFFEEPIFGPLHFRLDFANLFRKRNKDEDPRSPRVAFGRVEGRGDS
ncbi:MAG: hypothetical protein CBC48_15415 [bacterium TMED88]|nr:hypothetical protein [Deltaproteobacteria bacterium]OUV26464.1 MAG: hypothetical protein CBC48_15415 [bacterium TMED88]